MDVYAGEARVVPGAAVEPGDVLVAGAVTDLGGGVRPVCARADIRAKLQSLVRDFRARPGQLVLKAAPDAPVEALVFIVDEVRMQGGEKLLIATAQPDEPGRP